LDAKIAFQNTLKPKDKTNHQSNSQKQLKCQKKQTHFKKVLQVKMCFKTILQVRPEHTANESKIHHKHAPNTLQVHPKYAPGTSNIYPKFTKGTPDTPKVHSKHNSVP
jgi:hypothetical protein